MPIRKYALLAQGLTLMLGVMAACTFLLTASAQAQEYPGLYTQLGGGANFLEGMRFTGLNGITTKSTLNFDVGPVVTGSLGYVFGTGWRIEGEFGYRESPGKNVTLQNGATVSSPINFSTKLTAYSGMANVLYDVGLVPRWQVHVGGGIGLVNLGGNNSGTANVFGGQAIAGFDYVLTPQARLGIDYRFIGTQSAKLTYTIAGTSIGRTASSNYFDHAILVVLRWNFGKPPPAPAPMPAAAPPPPAPAPPQSFTVYFATNSATLSLDAQAILRQAVAAAQPQNALRIEVVGHTDTVASPAYNQRLSERRASSVRAELIRDGIPAQEIAARGVGETDLAVPTADNVNEPRNRRVEINFQKPGM